MTDWQTLYYVTFMVLFLVGRPDLWVAAIMAGNFVGSSLLGQDYLAVGVLDLICIALMLGKSREANIVAALYVPMLLVYAAATILGWSKDLTGFLIELLGYVQIVVMSNVLGGMGGRVRNAARRVFGSARHPRPAGVAQGVHKEAVARTDALLRKVGR